MGLALFTSSGTFKPSAYGLAPGDLIQIVVVGGGGGGGGATRAGSTSNSATAGGTSSFGSVATAPGGAAGANSARHPAMTFTLDTTEYYIAEQGEDGWVLNKNTQDVLSQLGAIIQMKSPPPTFPVMFPFRNARSDVDGATLPSGNRSPRTDGISGAGGVYADTPNRPCIGGGAGLGWGSGGGAGQADRYAGSPGKAGKIVFASYTLPNTNAISVTVGIGGTGGAPTNGGEVRGGGGCCGCVAIFW